MPYQLEWFFISTAIPSADDITVSHDPFTYTAVGGPISGDTTWRAVDSPHLVAGNNILVPEGTTLNIEPGVTVWFSDTGAMQVDGTLIALGTESQPHQYCDRSRVELYNRCGSQPGPVHPL